MQFRSILSISTAIVCLSSSIDSSSLCILRGIDAITLRRSDEMGDEAAKLEEAQKRLAIIKALHQRLGEHTNMNHFKGFVDFLHENRDGVVDLTKHIKLNAQKARYVDALFLEAENRMVGSRVESDLREAAGKRFESSGQYNPPEYDLTDKNERLQKIIDAFVADTNMIECVEELPLLLRKRLDEYHQAWLEKVCVDGEYVVTDLPFVVKGASRHASEQCIAREHTAKIHGDESSNGIVHELHEIINKVRLYEKVGKKALSKKTLNITLPSVSYQ